MKKIHIFANAALGKGLSGSDRIFIEFAKRWSKDSKVIVHVWEEGHQICIREGLENVEFKLINVGFWCNLGFLFCYLARIIYSIWDAFFIKVDSSDTISYSASDFWMDSLPAFILKIRFPKISWVASWYQTAPNPLVGFSQGNREQNYKLSAFYYWFVQLPIKPLIDRFADFVLVNNDLEKKQFKNLSKEKVIVVLGAVDATAISNWKEKNKSQIKKIDGIFQGRFHPQKGVVELVDIWKLVLKDIPNAKLVMIGDGPLMEDVKSKINNYKLEENIKLTGYLFDGHEKFKIFSESKIVLHPAFYDSGGMASAEAMAFGLPVIGFNLPSYESYYPKGMIKVTVGDLASFAKHTVQLLQKDSLRKKIGAEGEKWIMQNASWDKRAKEVFSKISNH